MKRGVRKTEILRIATDRETIKKFKKFVVENDFRTYHDALNWLLDNAPRRSDRRAGGITFL